MRPNRFPLPVDHARAPISLGRWQAVLTFAVIFACGVFVGVVASCVGIITGGTP